MGERAWLAFLILLFVLNCEIVWTDRKQWRVGRVFFLGSASLLFTAILLQIGDMAGWWVQP